MTRRWSWDGRAGWQRVPGLPFQAPLTCVPSRLLMPTVRQSDSELHATAVRTGSGWVDGTATVCQVLPFQIWLNDPVVPDPSFSGHSTSTQNDGLDTTPSSGG